MEKYLMNAKGIHRGGICQTICAAYGIKSNAKRFLEYTNGFAEPAVIEIRKYEKESSSNRMGEKQQG